MLRLAALNPEVAGFSALLADSQREGHRMLMRFAEHWASGENRFSLPGEVVLGAWAGEVLVGICGRNVDPYDKTPRAGRVRHLYVAVQARHGGVGRLLIRGVAGDAAKYFDYLNTNAPPEAHAFYVRLGFEPVGAPSVTHRLVL